MAVEIALAAVLGAVVGSFLNVVIHRVPLGRVARGPGSHCPSCGTPLAPYDNVPVVSWLVLRGRCRHCGAPISPRYPLVELLTAVAFAAVVAVRGFDDDLLLELPFVACLIALAGIDLDHRLLPEPDRLPDGGMGGGGHRAGGHGRPARAPDRRRRRRSRFLLVAALAYPAGMGMGDVKLAGAMGLYLGLSMAPALLASFLSGTVVGLGDHRARGRGARARRPCRSASSWRSAASWACSRAPSWWTSTGTIC